MEEDRAEVVHLLQQRIRHAAQAGKDRSLATLVRTLAVLDRLNLSATADEAGAAETAPRVVVVMPDNGRRLDQPAGRETRLPAPSER